MNNNNQEDAISPNDEFDNEDEIQYNEDTESALEAVQKLKSKLKICMTERGEYLDGWQRAKADLANARRNFENERMDIKSYAAESVILEILPVVDSFEMAFGNKTAWETVDKSWRTGVEYIYNQLIKILGNHNVTQFSPLGEQFDPAIHTAIATVPTNDPLQADRVVDVILKGYMLRDKVIRPAQVKTAHYESK